MFAFSLPTLIGFYLIAGLLLFSFPVTSSLNLRDYSSMGRISAGLTLSLVFCFLEASAE